jgi:hypothetical protein
MTTQVLGVIAFVAAVGLLCFGLWAIRTSGRETAIKLFVAVALLSVLTSTAFLSKIAQLNRDVYRIDYNNQSLIRSDFDRIERSRVYIEQPLSELRRQVKDMQENLDTLNKMHQYAPPKYDTPVVAPPK